MTEQELDQLIDEVSNKPSTDYTTIITILYIAINVISLFFYKGDCEEEPDTIIKVIKDC
jgi:hypothetical protein